MQRLRNLNLVPTSDNPALDTNPCTRPEVTLYKETMTLGPLDTEELEVFKAQFGALLAAPSSDERKIMLDRLPIYIIALRSIKHELNDVKFKGINPEDTEIGFGLIRPMFTRSGAAGTYNPNWFVNLAVAGTWQNWFHQVGVPYPLPNSFGLVITHLKSMETPTPFMSECAFQVGRTGILIPFDVRMLQVGDTENMTSIIPIPSMIAKPNGSLFAAAVADTAGIDNVALGGLVIGLGRILRLNIVTATWP